MEKAKYIFETGFPDGLTVRELKELIKDWPETDEFGEDRQVFIETKWCESNVVTGVSPLNLDCDKDGYESCDILLMSDAYNAK